MEGYETFKIVKNQNQVKEFEIQLIDIQDDEKLYVKEFAEVVFISGTTLILHGRIQKVSYGDGFRCNINGYGYAESKLLEKEFNQESNTTATWDDAKRAQYTNVSAQTIANELLSSNSDGSSPWIIEPNTSGLFDTDWGQISMRYEHANRLNALGKLVEGIDYEWDFETGVDYSTDKFQIAEYLPTTTKATTSQETFITSGASANCYQNSKDKDITNMINKIDVLGYGDGINQLHSSTYNASETYSTLASNITSSATTITLADATDFPASGTIRIMEEQVTYTGKSGNDLTGCTRGANSTTAYAHKKGVYVEKYVAISSAEAGSSIGEYGVLDTTLTDRSIIDLETLELIASRELIKKMQPIERINITPVEPETFVEERQVGELITITDSDAGISGDYRIVGITYTSYYGLLGIEVECSNRSLNFIEQMQKQKQANDNLSQYMQGATNIYAINESDNCDNTYPLNLRFYIPEEAIAINEVKLNFKTEKYRADSQSVTSAPNSQVNTSIWNSNMMGSVTQMNSPSEVNAHTSVSTFNNGLQYVGAGGQTGARDFDIPYTMVYDAGLGGYYVTAYESLGGNYRFFVAESFNDIDAIHYGTPGTTKVLGIGSYATSAWSTNPFTESTAENLTGTFDRIRLSFSLKNGSGSTKSPTITLSRTNGGGYTTVQTFTPTLSNGQIYENQVEETTDYRGYVYRLEVSGISGNDSFDTSWIVLNAATYIKSTDELDYGIYEDSFPTGSPQVAVAVGSEGSESAVTGSPFNISDGGSTQVDVTDAVRTVGSGNWINLKFTPQNGTSSNRVRIEANAYIQIFINSN